MATLNLKTGERVRNINRNSTRLGWLGVVVEERVDMCRNSYPNHLYTHVRYDNGQVQSYSKPLESRYIERVSSRQDAQIAAFGLRYGAQIANLSQLELLATANMLSQRGFTGTKAVHDEIMFTHKTSRRVLKKVRRNVISGKTQEDMVKELGSARGVQQFNTRCLGLSTGQALRVIGDAMCNPNTEIRISDIDHALSDGYSKSPRHQLNAHFRALVQSLLGNMKGFTFTNTHVVFNPIVTEETYVEVH